MSEKSDDINEDQTAEDKDKTEESLSERILVEEHRLFSQAIQSVIMDSMS